MLSNSSQFSANTYAERLMDDLFQDIEQLLDMQSPCQTDDTQSIEPVIPSDTSAQSTPQAEESGTDVALPLARIEPSSMPLPVLADGDRALAKVNTTPISDATNSKDVRPPKRSYERLLLALGCFSVVVSLGLYLLYQEGKFRPQVGIPVTVGSATTPAIAEPNHPFAEYAQKALRAIDQRVQQTNGAPSASVANPGAPGVPTVVIPPTNAPSPLTPNRAATGAERVYVPVYQIPSNLYPPGTAVAPLPTTPLPTSGTTKTPTKAQPKPAIAKVPTVSRKLVGVLDQGERSVALFETNGVTQRYELGESIGSSGWTLVEVTKDQAIIRRNGEVRSLFVGHSFQ